MVTLEVNNTFPDRKDVSPEITIEDDDQAAIKVGRLVRSLRKWKIDPGTNPMPDIKKELECAGIDGRDLAGLNVNAVFDTPKDINIVVRELNMDLADLEETGTRKERMASRRYLRALGVAVLKGCKR